MKVRHELTIHAKCPTNGDHDTYSVVVEVGRMLAVEDILSAVAALKTETLYQEQITQRLSVTLDATVTTTGYHSGVKTICTV